MTGCKDIIQNLQPYSKNTGVRIADGTLAPIAGIGSVRVTKTLTLFPVLYVPKLDCNLLSINQVTRDLQSEVKFSSSGCVLQEVQTGKMLGSGKNVEGLYIFQKHAHIVASLDSIEDKVTMWHFRLGHPSFLYLERLFPDLFLNKSAKHYQCEVCQLAKHTRSVYTGIGYQPTQPFAVIHSDIWGPIKVRNINGARWFITFIDDHTRLTWTFLMKDKSETTGIFQSFHSMIQTQFQENIRVLKTDNAHDYFNRTLGAFLLRHGIIHASSCVDTPQQNGLAERKNRHLLEVARASMFTHHIPKYLWGEAVLTATYLINRLPSRVLNFKTPRQVLLTQFPHISSFTSDLTPKIFGCTVFIHTPPHQRSKLDPRSQKGVLIGYSATQKGYKCYVPQTRKVYNTRDVTFFESQPYFHPTAIQGESTDDVESQRFVELIALDEPNEQRDNSSQGEPSNSSQGDRPSKPLIVYQRRNIKKDGVTDTQNTEGTNEEVVHEVEVEQMEEDVNPSVSDLDIPIALRKGTRRCARYPIAHQVSYEKLEKSHKAFTSNLDSVMVPKTIHEALKLQSWKKAVLEELKALEQNGTWEVVPLPHGKNTVDCKWLFTVKYKANGTIERFKARLVARGFTQSYGVDYEETFAPVAKLNTVRVLLSLAANLDWPLHQLDVKNAFLNGDLAEEVYMSFPPGVQNPKEGLVCKLKKALYGLKQSPRAWFDRFTKAVKEGGYYQCQTDHTLFVKHSSTGKVSILIVYVDDIIITGDDVEEITSLKSRLAREFEIKDLGHLTYFLGMEVSRSNQGIVLSQRKYILDLLGDTGMENCKPIDTPMEQNKRLSKSDDVPLVEKGTYQRLVGKLIYLAHTRPDIAFAVSIVSQHMHSPNEEHMEMVVRILRYLKHEPGKGIQFRKTTRRDVTVYTDASWAGELTDRKSTSGYCSYIWGNLVTWRSKKQNVVARSSAEAEYRALSLGICEGIWLKRVLNELRIVYEGPVQLLSDSQAALSIVRNPVHHDRTKHVEIDRHFITSNVTEGIIQVEYVPSKQQTADILTKALARDDFGYLSSKLGLINIYTKLEGEC
ncbi:Retrovirus-related Pol polyprotein from transposon TNT 1-94 [Linum perenne]